MMDQYLKLGHDFFGTHYNLLLINNHVFMLCNVRYVKVNKYDVRDIRKGHRRILGPVYKNEKENWRILTNKEIYKIVKKSTITETIRLNRLLWFGHVQRFEENRIPKRVLYTNLEERLRGRQRNRLPNEVREDGRIVCGEEWQEKVYNREEWKKLLRTAKNRCILHMAVE
jgi:hypothetical protein